MAERERCTVHDKAMFPSRAEANGALHAIRAMGSGKVPTRAYWTEECGCYHLTSNPPRYVRTGGQPAREPRQRKGSRKRR